jgi:Transposase DDE domain
MSRHDGLCAWTETVSTNMPHLSKPQATGLALWSYGIALTRSCGRTTVATFLALLVTCKVGNMDHRLREWCYEADAKAGSKRQALEVTRCFAPLLRWIVRLWQGTSLALAIDATSLSDRFTVLCVSVVVGSTGIPVAWTILPANQKHAWRREWLRMLCLLRPAIPADWTVLVLADRGLYAPWLFRRIVRLGWHPFLRINQAAKFRPAGQATWYWLRELCGQPDQRWRGAGTAFITKESQIACTLVAWWGAEYQEPWFILTDLEPDGCDASWYGVRAWCEQGFKVYKRGGWHWQQTRMTKPERAARLWLALAVATLWMVSVGTELDGAGRAALAGPEVTPLLAAAGLVRTGQGRRTRLLRLGWLWVLVQLITAQLLPLPQQLHPAPWPAIPQRLELPFRNDEVRSYVPLEKTAP